MEHSLNISDFTTRELKNALHSNYRFDYEDYYAYDDKPKQFWVGQRHLPGGQLTGFYATEAKIRAELRKRPHLPSKKEDKTIRRLMAKPE